jgi:hypothetical protein
MRLVALVSLTTGPPLCPFGSGAETAVGMPKTLVSGRSDANGDNPRSGADWLRVYIHSRNHCRWHGQRLTSCGEVSKVQRQCVTQKGGNFLYGISGDATTGDIGRVSREVVAPLDDNRVSQVCAPSPYIRAKSLPAFG